MKKLFGGCLLCFSLYLLTTSVYKESIMISTYYNEKSVLEKEETMRLEIPEWNFERFIKEGAVNHIDDLFATYIPGNKNNIIIAGHDIPIVFHQLQKIQIGMDIYLKKGNKVLKYVVVDRRSVKPTEIQYMYDSPQEQLTLITCTENNQKRLIIICVKK